MGLSHLHYGSTSLEYSLLHFTLKEFLLQPKRFANSSGQVLPCKGLISKRFSSLNEMELRVKMLHSEQIAYIDPFFHLEPHPVDVSYLKTLI